MEKWDCIYQTKLQRKLKAEHCIKISTFESDQIIQRFFLGKNTQKEMEKASERLCKYVTIINKY